jgi:hypothetical protein
MPQGLLYRPRRIEREVAHMRMRSRWSGVAIGALGVTLALLPLSAASATHVKGSAPNSAMCKTVRAEENSLTAASSGIEKALASGNFASGKQAVLKLYNTDFGQAQKALASVRHAPAKVRAAFKNLVSSVKQFRTTIQNASSLQDLLTSFAALGQNPQLQTDGTTIANWYSSVCGGSLVTTTTASLP